MSLSIAAGSPPPSFYLGRTARGLWVLRDVSGSQSGTFRSREAAIRFAQLSRGDRKTPVAVLPEGVEPVRLGDGRQ